MSGVFLFIIITILSILGFYYVSDIIISALFRDNKKSKFFIIIDVNDVQKSWQSVAELKKKYKNTKIVILQNDDSTSIHQNFSSILNDVEFATPKNLADLVYGTIKSKENYNDVIF